MVPVPGTGTVCTRNQNGPGTQVYKVNQLSLEGRAKGRGEQSISIVGLTFSTKLKNLLGICHFNTVYTMKLY